MPSSGMLHRVILERSASIVRVTRIGVLGTGPKSVTSQKMAFFIVTAVKTSNLT
jgi:hypothetical protein